MNKEGLASRSSMNGTKWGLFRTAINLFATSGYANVSIRDIAAAISLNPASIYNHFPSKDSILTSAYNFYIDNYYASLPLLDELVDLIPKLPPREVWEKIRVVYEPELLDIMTKIALIAIDERRHDPAAHSLVSDVFVKVPRKYLETILTEMTRQGIIEPVDIDQLVNIYSAFNLYVSVRIGGDHSMSIKEWNDGHDFIFSSIKLKQRRDSLRKHDKNHLGWL